MGGSITEKPDFWDDTKKSLGEYWDKLWTPATEYGISRDGQRVALGDKGFSSTPLYGAFELGNMFQQAQLEKDKLKEMKANRLLTEKSAKLSHDANTAQLAEMSHGKNLILGQLGKAPAYKTYYTKWDGSKYDTNKLG